MRISDWSSDVCSSDLFRRNPAIRPGNAGGRFRKDFPRPAIRPAINSRIFSGDYGSSKISYAGRRANTEAQCDALESDPRPRSEEHTSELQSLMRISYAVFCLKKQKQTTQHKTTVKYIVTTSNNDNWTQTII